MFSYVRETYVDNNYLREDIFILETEIWEKDSLINNLQRDNIILKEKLKEKKKPKDPKKIKKGIEKTVLPIIKDTLVNVIDTLNN